MKNAKNNPQSGRTAARREARRVADQNRQTRDNTRPFWWIQFVISQRGEMQAEFDENLQEQAQYYPTEYQDHLNDVRRRRRARRR